MYDQIFFRIFNQQTKICTNKNHNKICSACTIFIWLVSIVAVNRHAVRWECWMPDQLLGMKYVSPYERPKPVDALGVRAAVFSYGSKIALGVENVDYLYGLVPSML